MSPRRADNSDKPSEAIVPATLIARKNSKFSASVPLRAEFIEQGCVVLLEESVVMEVRPGKVSVSGPYELQIVEPKVEEPSLITKREHSIESETKVADSSAEPISIDVYPLVEGYHLQGFLGRGGMGTVWSAHQLSTNRKVAVKMINSRMMDDPDAQRRFKREVQLAAKLSHPHIARIYDSGLANGQYFYSMEFVDGLSWNRYVRKRKPARSVILNQLLQVLDAVGAAHAAGVVHRDLKPSNILIDKADTAFVVDFGLAKQQVQSDEELTHGGIVGTYAFMPPEQASGRSDAVDARSDVYAIGAMILYLLDDNLSHTIASQPRKPNRSLVATLNQAAATTLSRDPQLHSIVRKAISNAPEDRFCDADHFGRALRDYIAANFELTTRDFSSDPLPTTAFKQAPRWSWIIPVTVVAVLMVTGLATIYPTRHFSSGKAIDPVVEKDGKAEDVKPANVIQIEIPTEAQWISTRMIGARRDQHEELKHPQHWPVVGLKFRISQFKDDDIVKTVELVFRDPKSDTVDTSKVAGLPTIGEEFSVIAREGYAFAGLQGYGKKRLSGMKLVFMRIEADGVRLDPNDRYESSWYAGEASSDEIQLGCTGDFVLGIRSSYDADINNLGLLMLAK